MMPLHYVRHNRHAVCSCSNGLRAGAASGRPTPKTEREREQERERERERERDQAAKLARAQGCVSDMADDCQQTQKARWKTARVLHSHGVRGPAQGGRSQEASGWPEAAETERLILEPVAPLRAWREVRSCVVSSGAGNASTAGKDPA